MAAANSDICDICRDSFSLNRQKTVSTISCGHVFHEICLKKWFQTQRTQGNPTSCPNCRRETRFDQIIRLYGINNVPATRPVISSVSVSSLPDIRRTICERSRLLNENERPEVTTWSATTTLANIGSRLRSIFYINDEFSRKVYSTLAVKLRLTLGLIMLATFHNGSKQFICEHYLIIIFAACFMCLLIYSITSSDELYIVGGGSIFGLSMVTIGNVWSLEPCVTTMYPLQTLIFAITLTTVAAFVLTKIAFKMESNLTAKPEALGSGLCLLIVCFIIWRFADKENLVVCLILQSLCLLVCCCYVIMFTQFMKENDYNRPNEYVSLAMGLYVSIINMFIFTLRIVGETT